MSRPHLHPRRPFAWPLTRLACLIQAGLPLLAGAQALEPTSARSTQTITVTGSTIDDRFGDSARDPSSTVNLSGRRIEEQHVENLMQVLRAVPGLTVDYAGGDELKIKFRGVENQRYMGEKPGVAIVIDGVPVYERTGKVNIDLDNIDTIRIVKGGASYLYGEDALAGAVVITTKRGANNRGISIEADQGAHGYQRRLARVGFANDGWSGHLQASNRQAEGYHFQSDYEAQAVTGNLRWSPDGRSDLTLGVEVEDRFRDKHGTVTGVTQAENDPRGTIGRDFARHFDVQLDRVNLTYSRDLDDQTNLLALVYQYRDHTKFWSSPQRFSGTGAAVTSSDAYTTDNDYQQTQRGAKGELRSTLGPVALMGGVEIKRNEYLNFTSARVDYRNSPVGATVAQGTVAGDDETIEATRALYGELKWSPAEAWTLTGNLRHDRLGLDYADRRGTLAESADFGKTSWRLGAAFASSAQTTWFANVSTGFRAPTADQLYRGSISPTSAVANNPDLKPETSLTMEAGVRTMFGWLGQDSSLEASIFQIDRDDFILDSNGQYSGSNSANIARYENIGGARSRGLELALKNRVSPTWSWDLAYTWLDAYFTRYDNFLLSLGNNRGAAVGSTPACSTTPTNWNSCYRFVAYDNTGKKVPRTSPHVLNLRSSWQATQTLRLTGELDARSRAWADEINQEKWAGRTLFNLTADYGRKLSWPAGARLSAFLRVDNVFDKTFYKIARGTNDSQSPTTGSRYDGVYNAQDLSITVDEGRVWRAGLALRF